MIIYLDLLFLREILFNSIIIFLTGKIIDQNPKPTKKIMGNIFGSIYTIVLITTNYKLCNNSLVHILCALTIIITTFKNENFYELLKNTLIFYIVTYTLGGILTYTQTQNKNYCVYIIAMLLVLPRLVQKYKTKYKLNTYYGKLTLPNYKSKEEMIAFIDTGHELTSIYGEPVIILSQKYKGYSNILFDRTISFNTINEEKISVLGAKQKGIILEYEKNKYENDAIIIIANNDFEKYDAIIGLDFFTNAKKKYKEERENKKNGNIILDKKQN